MYVCMYRPYIIPILRPPCFWVPVWSGGSTLGVQRRDAEVAAPGGGDHLVA